MSDAKWSRLENAAKIFPSTTRKVFSFTCELTEMVQEAPLQAALEETLEFFPFYRYSLRRGLFWYFYEESREKPVVRQEHLPPCSKLYHPDRHGLLFSVTYYRCRINLEVYHSLTDGTGALAFLRMLTIHYIITQGRENMRNRKSNGLIGFPAFVCRIIRFVSLKGQRQHPRYYKNPTNTAPQPAYFFAVCCSGLSMPRCPNGRRNIP